MNPRKLIWLAVALIALSLGTVLLWRQRAPTSVLPSATSFPSRSAAFNGLLASAQHAITTPPIDRSAVRRLARLYQANLLTTEARACYAWLAGPGGGLTAEDHRLLADLSLNAGDLPQGIVELRATLAADPSYAPARIVLAEALFKSGDAAGAGTEYHALLGRVPDQPQALLGLARVALQRSDDATAIAQLERLLAVHRDATSGAALLAQIMNRRGEAERAAALTEWSRQKRDPVPLDPWLDVLWADCYDVQRLTLRFEELVYSGELEQAQPLLERVAQLDPANWLPHLLRAWTLDRDRHPTEAVGEYRLALQKSGDPERILPLLVPCLLGLNRAAEAEEDVNRALQTHPDSVALLTLQADLVLRRGGEVKPLLVALLQKEPYLYKPNMDLAKILWTQGDHAGSVVCLTRVTKAFPVDVPSRGLLGQFYLENKDPAAAIVPLEQALPQAESGSAARDKISALLASAYLQVGVGCRAAGKAAEAADYFAKAAKLAPEGLNALAQLADAAVQAKQFRAAAEALGRLAGLQPDNPTIQISLGDVLYQASDTTAARAHWEQALQQVAPNDTALRRALDARLSGHITPELFE